MPIKESICSRILTPKQFGSICWFMATFVALFYSQRSRKLLLEASNTWNITKDELFELLYDILHNKYLKKGKNGEDYDNFSDDIFIKILSLLHKNNKDKFPFNPKNKNMLKAFRPQLYIGKLYTLLGIDHKIFDYSTKQYILRYSYLNKEYDDLRIFKIKDETIIDEIEDKEGILKDHKYIEDNYSPTILIIRVYDYEIPIYDSILPNNIIPNGSKNSGIRYRNDNVIYNEKNYTLDSVILTNNNNEDNNGHIIAGITCKGKRYIYNGWIRQSSNTEMANKGITRDIPCELMPYNWNIMFDNDFCLNIKNCKPDILKTKVEKGNYCFNFSKGVRILIYVRDDAKSKTSKEKSSSKEEGSPSLSTKGK
jgi:hypothetical protein